MTSRKKVICYGEILKDVFPDKERIGGAPLNVASRLSSFGIDTAIISKVGKDKKGKELLSFLKKNKVDTHFVFEDNDYPTGVVQVKLSAAGSASYEIRQPAAWDRIEISEEILNAVSSSDAFVFGSLICRSNTSRETLFQLLPNARFKVLDINIRRPYYDKEILLRLIQQAEFIKFNDDELFEISEMFGSPYNSIEQNMLFIKSISKASFICVTKGMHGAVLLSKNKWYYNSGFRIIVKDTVGAGDSFLAALLANILWGKELQESLDHACAVGALVAGREGGNPVLKPETFEEFLYPNEN